jgi:hypothetical protein
MNSFQKHLLDKKNKHKVWEIIKFLHPTLVLEDKYISKKEKERSNIENLHVYRNYNWVCISGTLFSNGKNYKIDLAIKFDMRFKDGSLILGPSQPMKSFDECYQCDNFRAWRFRTDSNYDELKLDKIDINPLLKKLKVDKPTAKEMYNYYYED